MDKHFNEHGGLPTPLDDDQPTDMPATVSIFVMIVVVAAIALAVLALFQSLG
ncbi:MAG TPA: hypothetical protein PK760_11835 [Flavobacteriales bacterium]|nr:hypothetical protein [Flavobacteriales bacterium]